MPPEYEEARGPGFKTAVCIFLIPRLLSAILNPISDCDETYNYWEPLHYVSYQFGFQTWEYSPIYALRSYLYIVYHKLLLQSASFLGKILLSPLIKLTKPIEFYALRGILGIICAFCEAKFYRSCIRKLGRNTGIYLLWLLVWNAGMFNAGTALLPSSFVMHLIMVFMACWMDEKYARGVLYSIVAVLCGWPYVGIMFVPFAIEAFMKRGIWPMLGIGCVLGFSVLALEVSVNYHYYQRFVLPAWNIVKYNVLSNDTDSTLYGEEPATFYLYNILLNFNLLAFLVPLAVVLVLMMPSAWQRNWHLLLYVSPLYLWLAIMFSQRHKEERFLFPIYPLVVLAASLALAAVDRILMKQRTLGYIWHFIILRGVFLLYILVSVSRITSTVINFRAPALIYQHLHDHILPNSFNSGLFESTSHVHLCISKEWYRFPTSFFIPSNATTVQFLKSSFAGQLPKLFEPHDRGTSIVPTEMNNQNKEEVGRYVSLNQCDIVVDLNLPTQVETKLWEFPSDWKMVHYEWFMDASASRSPYRSFYIPFVTPKHVRYVKYAIYKRTQKQGP